MLDTLFWIGVGMLIGWHIPQPFWVKVIIDKIIDLIKQKIFSFKK